MVAFGGEEKEAERFGWCVEMCVGVRMQSLWLQGEVLAAVSLV